MLRVNFIVWTEDWPGLHACFDLFVLLSEDFHSFVGFYSNAVGRLRPVDCKYILSLPFNLEESSSLTTLFFFLCFLPVNYALLNQQEPLKEGDIVKIDLGCHIDGYISVAAHTLVVPAGPDSPPAGDDEVLGNVAVAAYNAMLVAADAIKAGATNADVTKAVERVASSYGVSPISTVRMHQMKRFVIDGVKEVALKEPTADELEEGEEKVPECTFEQGEVYAVDVALSTGDGKVRPGTLRTTVFKRNVETSYKLKMKASRYVLSEVDKKFPTLPFTLRHFEEETQAKMGVQECVAHGLLTPYPCLHEKAGEKVAHFKCTVLLLPSGTSRVTGLDMPEYFKTDKTPDEETGEVLAAIAEKAAKKAKKKAAKKKKKKASS